VPESNTGACTEGSPKAPAAQAGIRPGDKITAFDGTPVKSWDELSAKLKQHGGEEVTLTIVRDGTSMDKSVRLAQITDTETGKKVGFLGVTADTRVAGYQTYGPVEAVGKTGQVFVTEIGLIFKTLAAVPAAIPKLFSPERGETE